VGESKIDFNDVNSLGNILKTFRPNDTVSVTLNRGGATLRRQVACKSTATNLSLRIVALEFAAAGDFFACYAKAREDNSHLVKAFTFSLQTSCGKHAGQLSAQEVAVRQVQYWGLRFDDIKALPNSVELLQKLRPNVLGDITALETTGQLRLGNELDRMLSIASGTPSAPPREAAVGRIYPAPVIRNTVSPRRRSAVASGSTDCESGHWVESVTDDGEIVKLEDGSIWEVSAGDTVDSALWLPTTEIIVCDGRLINTDDNEKVDATRIR
jgi:hypothetical protein